MTIPSEKVHEAAEVTAARLNASLVELRRLFLVEDLVDSAKFGLVLWILTYIGACFNGLTLVILGNLQILFATFPVKLSFCSISSSAIAAIFTVPKVYEMHQEKIDQNINFVRGKVNEIIEK